METGVDLTAAERARIESVLRQHMIMFADGLVTSAVSVRRECLDLLGSLDRLTEAQTRRITSILLQHEIIFGARGPVSVPAHLDHLDLTEALRRERLPEPAPPLGSLPPVQSPPAAAPEPVRAEPPLAAAAPTVAAPVFSPPPTPPSVLGDRSIRLFGPGRRTRLPQGGAMLLFLHYDDATDQGAVAIHPLGWVSEARLDQEPIAVTLSGPCHYVLVRGDGTAGDLGYSCGPLPMPSFMDDPYVIHVVGGRRILLSSRPSRLSGRIEIQGSMVTGVYGFCIPEDGRAFQRITDLLREFLSRRAGLPTVTSDHVAYFAAARLVGSGFAGSLPA